MSCKVVGNKLVVGDKCRKIYKKNKDGTVYIYPQFTELWNLLWAVGNINIPQPLDDTIPVINLPTYSTSILVGSKSNKETDFISFVNDNIDTKQPIINQGIRLVPYSDELQLRIRWRLIDTKNIHNDVEVGFYTISSPGNLNPNRMHLMVDKENRLTLYKANRCNDFSGEFTMPGNNSFFVNIPTKYEGQIELMADLILPYNPPHKAEVGTVYFKPVGYDCCVPVYKLKPGIEDYNFLKVPVQHFEQLSKLINKTFEITSLSLLLPITLSKETGVDPVIYKNILLYNFNTGCCQIGSAPSACPASVPRQKWSDTSRISKSEQTGWWLGTPLGIKVPKYIPGFVTNVTVTVVADVLRGDPIKCYYGSNQINISLFYRSSPGVFYKLKSYDPLGKIQNASYTEPQPATAEREITASFNLLEDATQFEVCITNVSKVSEYSFSRGQVRIKEVVVKYVKDPRT